MRDQPITRRQSPAHEYDGTRDTHHLAFRHQEIALLGAGDEMHIQLYRDIRAAIRRFPHRMAKGLIQEGGNHATMDNAMDIAVLFFYQKSVQAAPIHGFLPEGTNQGGEAILMPDEIRPAIGGGVIGCFRVHGGGCNAKRAGGEMPGLVKLGMTG